MVFLSLNLKPLNQLAEPTISKDIIFNNYWLIKCANDWLKPLYDLLHTEFLKLTAIHVDETELQVLKEPGKKPQSKSYMWLYRSGGYEEHQIALYDYAPSRSAKHVVDFLSEFSGFCHVDAYQAYKKLPQEVTLVECLAHARRKFSEALAVLTAEQKKESKAAIGLAYCNKLFNIEAEVKEDSPEVRYKVRQEKAKPILDEFFAWLNTCNATPKSHFGRAVSYTLNQWSYLVNYLLDGRLDISNNRAEHLAKSFAVCRKNFLFSNTAKGAEASAITYRIISTAMLNNLDPFEYLSHIFRTAPNMDMESNDKSEISSRCKSMIEERFMLDIPVVTISLKELSETLDNAPEWWDINSDEEVIHQIIFLVPFVFMKKYKINMSDIGFTKTQISFQILQEYFWGW